MKKLYVGFITAMVALSLTSCSTFEEVDAPQEKLLNYKINRDAEGRYSIDFNVADNTNVESFKNITSRVNEYYLTDGVRDAKAQYREDFSLEDNAIKIGFFDANSEKNDKITVYDKNATFAKGGDGEFLQEVSLKKNTDGTYQLDFRVSNGVKTEFKYDEDLDVYEVHLSKGDATEKRFSRTLEMSDTEVLTIDFMHHKYAGKGMETVETGKPLIIVTKE
ncbi:MAG: hypothetical protein JKZ00_05370 [Flavobacteriaceae bacterium]|nr:hypothetical protein [Flavobacteriaceae bacterium]